MAKHQQQFHQQSEHSKPFRNLFTVDDNQTSSPITFFNAASFADQSNPQYMPPFHVAGFAPGPPPDGGGGGDPRWINGSQPKRKRVVEEDFLDNSSNNNFQTPSAGLLQKRSVSTGLGLSIDDKPLASLGESPVFSFVDDEINREFQRQDAEIDRLIKMQGEQLRQTILKKVQGNKLQTLSIVEERILQKLREKEVEVENINKKNTELEEQMKQLAVEAGTWKHRAKCNENIITALKINLQQVARSRDSKEGCGDSEVDDTASCCNGTGMDVHLVYKEFKDMKEVMTCKACRVNEVCMLLLPCRHLCLCKDCESKLSFCPLCRTSKFLAMEVYM